MCMCTLWVFQWRQNGTNQWVRVTAASLYRQFKWEAERSCEMCRYFTCRPRFECSKNITSFRHMEIRTNGGKKEKKKLAHGWSRRKDDGLTSSPKSRRVLSVRREVWSLNPAVNLSKESEVRPSDRFSPLGIPQRVGGAEVMNCHSGCGAPSECVSEEKNQKNQQGAQQEAQSSQMNPPCVGSGSGGCAY